MAKIEKTVQGSILMISVKFAVGTRWPGLYLEGFSFVFFSRTTLLNSINLKVKLNVR